MSLTPCLLLAVLFSQCFAYQWPSPQYDALETLLYEGRRSDGSSLAAIQHPCKTRSGTGASIGAEWLRLAYHDSATYNVIDGTGGLDASIAFELGREENVGIGMVQTLSDFETFPNKYVSRADVIAIGVTMAIASCNGPIIPFRGGRVDALQAGPLGVPVVEQDVETHKRLFANQGFSATEMIGLVACGHTLGGVRSTDFPNIVQPGERGTPRIQKFDTSPNFDNAIVTEYFLNTTENPLVVARNTTLNSDSRIFGSDGNVTMHGLKDSSRFQETCSVLIAKMLNSVPSSVQLTPPIELIQTKVSDALLTVEHDELVFKVTLRVAQKIGTAVDKGQTVKLFWCDRFGEFQDCQGQARTSISASSSQDDPQTSPLAARLGFFFVRYNFVVKVNPAQSLSLFWFAVQSGGSIQYIDNENKGYRLQQDQLIYLPMYSSSEWDIHNDTLKTYHIVAGVRSSEVPSRVYLNAFDNAMLNYTTPLNRTYDMQKQNSRSLAGYTLYSTSLQDIGTQLTLDISAEIGSTTYTQDFQQTFFLDTSIPYTPPTASDIVKMTTLPFLQDTSFAMRMIAPSFHLSVLTSALSLICAYLVFL